jgi:probable phosphoglycerate mutase
VRVVVEADGGSRGNPGPAGYGALVRDADTGEVLAEVAAGIGVATNNVAEYRGLLAGLAAAAELPGVESVEVRMDSKLVVEQMSGRWQVKHPDMRVLRREAADLVARLPAVTFTHVRRELNSHADRLANEAMDAAARGESWVRHAVAKPVGWQSVRGEPTTVLLLRHGQTAMSVEKRFSGHGDPPLTPHGESQAKALGARLHGRDVAAVWSSPLSRALETARALGLGEPHVDDRLKETDFGAWEGLTFGEIQERYPAELAAWLADPSVPAPGGESFAQVTTRVRQARDALLAAHGGETVVVVSHVTPIKVLLRLALDAPSALYRIHLDLASITRVDWYPDGNAVVRTVNDVAHLDGLPSDV